MWQSNSDVIPAKLVPYLIRERESRSRKAFILQITSCDIFLQFVGFPCINVSSFCLNCGSSLSSSTFQNELNLVLLYCPLVFIRVKRIMPQKFSATIAIAGINPYVVVPLRVSKVFGRRGNIPVRGKLNDVSISGTLVPAGNGHHRFYINGEMRKKAKVGAGDEITLSLEFDNEPRILPVPEALRLALENDEEAEEAWGNLTPSRRKEILTYLNWLKTPDALERNVRKVITIIKRQRAEG